MLKSQIAVIVTTLVVASPIPASGSQDRLACASWQAQWEAEGSAMSLAELHRFRSRVVSARCPAVVRAINNRIDTLQEPTVAAAPPEPTAPDRPPPAASPPPVADSAGRASSPSTRPPAPIDSLVATSCGGSVIAAPAGATMPLGGADAILNTGNGSDCLLAPPGQALVLEIRTCPQAAEGVSTVSVRRSTRALSGTNSGAYAPVIVSAAGEGASGYREIGRRQSFGDVRITTGGPIPGIRRLRIEVPNGGRFQQGICAIEVR